MKILMVGDIVGAPGRQAFARLAGAWKREGLADMVVANGENAAGGKGLTGELAEELFAAGADVLTLGDHAWDQKSLADYIDRETRVLRPANFAPACPGHGCVTVDVAGSAVTVINLVGRVFMSAVECPFRTADALLQKQPDLGRIVLVDMHAEATSEKVALGRYLDGRVSCVVGTHTHVQTSDEKILPGGTAYITDLGMTGPSDSVIGRDTESVLQMFLTGMPSRFKVATSGVVLEAVLVSIDEKTGKARRIKRLREQVA